MPTTTQEVLDTVNDDGSVTRVTTTTTTYTAEEYQLIQDNIKNQIDILQAKLTPIQANVGLSQKKSNNV